MGENADSGSLSFLLIDDDPDLTALVAALLGLAGHRVVECATPSEGLRSALANPPDCIILDLILPEMSGIELCERLRAEASLAHTKIVVLSAKPYGQDQEKARKVGADAYLVKPVDTQSFIPTINELVREQVELRFWGVRGTLPLPGPGSVRYGGNTCCISMSFADGRMLIFDAGSGIYRLGESLAGASRGKRLHLLISHLHLDHISALSTFAPLYQSGVRLDIYGPGDSDADLHQALFTLMEDVYWPVTTRGLAANIRCHALTPGETSIDGIAVRTLLLHHPGACLGYRVDYRGRSFCYVTDNELRPKVDDRHERHYFSTLADFVRGCHLLVTDTTYSDEAYPTHAGWGHSPVSEVARLVHHAEVKHWCLFHHDPSDDDEAIDRKLDQARTALDELGCGAKCEAPMEGSSAFL
jgi:CheY-like chemotaxis protein